MNVFAHCELNPTSTRRPSNNATSETVIAKYDAPSRFSPVTGYSLIGHPLPQERTRMRLEPSILMSRSLRHFGVKVSRLYLLFIDKHGIHYVVSTDQTTQARHAKLSVLTDGIGTRQQGKEDHEASSQTAQCELDTGRAR